MVDDVVAFITKASQVYGRHKDDEFNQLRWAECCEIESPIEQYFLVALHLVSEINLVCLSVIREHFNDDNDDLLVIPQWKVGQYKVDFAIRQHPKDRVVCVELDGHEFHDRDEHQRRYEKTRDRFLTTKGYSILHFTGAEVVKDPCAVALEAFNVATGLAEVSIHPFD
mgnify:FL=1